MNKILHRIYFGFDKKPDIYANYLQTWKKELPDYQIMHWNADNLPIDANNYTKALYQEKDHAFLSDYFRWWVLKEHGGIYLDADIEITNGRFFNELVEKLANSPDYHSFLGVEISDYQTYTAHSVACKKQSPLAEFMCSVYENMHYFRYWRKKADMIATKLIHLYFIHHGYTQNDGWLPASENKIYAGVKIYPKDFFSPLSIGTTYFHEDKNKYENIWYAEDHSDNSCLCHHYSNSYIDILPLHERQNIFYNDYLKIRDEDLKKYKYKEITSTSLKDKIRNSFLQRGMHTEWEQIKNLVSFNVKRSLIWHYYKFSLATEQN